MRMTTDLPKQFLGIEWYADLEASIPAYIVRAITADGTPIIGWMQRDNGVFVWIVTNPAVHTTTIAREVGECLATLNARR